jgi:pyruvate,water dikinase
MYEAGGRLFVDVTRDPGFAGEPRRPREGLGEIRSADRDALQTILERGDFIRSLPDEGPGGAPAAGAPAPIETDPAIVAELIGRTRHPSPP